MVCFTLNSMKHPKQCIPSCVGVNQENKMKNCVYPDEGAARTAMQNKKQKPGIQYAILKVNTGYVIITIKLKKDL